MMERLTEKHEADAQRKEYERRLANGYPRNIPEERFLRLAAYEDTGLMPAMCANYKTFEDEAISKGVTFKRIVELMEADKDGRLVVLPCKVGDTVWIAGSVRGVYSAKVRTFFCGHSSAARGADDDGNIQMIRTTDCDIPIRDFGKVVFLTREDAERALEGRNVCP